MATHSSVLACKVPWTEKPSGPQSMGCKESDMTEQLCTGHVPTPFLKISDMESTIHLGGFYLCRLHWLTLHKATQN